MMGWDGVGMGRVGGDGEWTMWTGWERNGKESKNWWKWSGEWD